jgi:pantoate kinase
VVKTCAFSPGGISSFFEICDYTPEGTPILDEAHIGARGGGFFISRGVFTEICADSADANQIHVFINGRPRPDAYTTKTVAEALLALTPECYHVTVTHFVEIPVAAGFGSSGAGALGTALALSNALKLPHLQSVGTNSSHRRSNVSNRFRHRRWRDDGWLHTNRHA